MSLARLLLSQGASCRQVHVAELVAKGWSDKQISGYLQKPEQAVRRWVREVQILLEVQKRSDIGRGV